MSAETLITAALRANAPVLAVVPSERIARDWLSQEYALPAIVTERAATEYVNTIHTGVPVAEKVTMDTWCIAKTRLAAEQLADKVIVALSDADFLVVGRRPDLGPDENTYAAIVSADVWL